MSANYWTEIGRLEEKICETVKASMDQLLRADPNLTTAAGDDALVRADKLRQYLENLANGIVATFLNALQERLGTALFPYKVAVRLGIMWNVSEGGDMLMLIESCVPELYYV